MPNKHTQNSPPFTVHTRVFHHLTSPSLPCVPFSLLHYTVTFTQATVFAAFSSSSRLLVLLLPRSPLASSMWCSSLLCLSFLRRQVMACAAPRGALWASSLPVVTSPGCPFLFSPHFCKSGCSNSTSDSRPPCGSSCAVLLLVFTVLSCSCSHSCLLALLQNLHTARDLCEAPKAGLALGLWLKILLPWSSFWGKTYNFWEYLLIFSTAKIYMSSSSCSS